MPQVIIEQPGIPPMTVSLSGDETRFGRSEDSDVTLVADEVSRNHAKICRVGGRSVLFDLQSLNGTYVNRQRIVERVLSHMDEIWFGSRCHVIFRDDAEASGDQSSSETPFANPELVKNLDKIREEMDRVGSSMTLMGSPAPPIAAEKKEDLGTTPEEIVRMSRAYRRLAALHQASQIMASSFNLRDRLARVLDMVMETMDADRGFVMLREGTTNNLNVKVARQMGRELEASSPSMGIAGRAAIDGEAVLMADSQKDSEFGMRESIIRSEISSAMCVPLRIDDRILGSIYLDTYKPYVTFTEEDLELFASLASQSALAIDHVRLHEEVVNAEMKRQEFGRFLSPAIVDKIMSEEKAIELGGQRTTVSTLFCDIRGFTNTAERIAPGELVQMLNEYFTAMTEIVFQFQGTLDKYVGDELMAIFGAPVEIDNNAFSAVSAAVAIQQLNAELNEVRKKEGRTQIQLGIGIDTGEVTAGYFGSPMRMEYTVMGDRVNTASRFCSLAGPGQVIVGAETWSSIKEKVEGKEIGPVVLKGKELKVPAYEILSIKP